PPRAVEIRAPLRVEPNTQRPPNRYIEQRPRKGDQVAPTLRMPWPCVPALSDGQSRHIAPPCLSTPRTRDSGSVWLSSTSRCTPTSTLRLAGSAGLVSHNT